MPEPEGNCDIIRGAFHAKEKASLHKYCPYQRQPNIYLKISFEFIQFCLSQPCSNIKRQINGEAIWLKTNSLYFQFIRNIIIRLSDDSKRLSKVKPFYSAQNEQSIFEVSNWNAINLTGFKMTYLSVTGRNSIELAKAEIRIKILQMNHQRHFCPSILCIDALCFVYHRASAKAFFHSPRKISFRDNI